MAVLSIESTGVESHCALGQAFVEIIRVSGVIGMKVSMTGLRVWRGYSVHPLQRLA